MLDRDDLKLRVFNDASDCKLKPLSTKAYIVMTHCNEVPDRDMFRDTECACLDKPWVDFAVPDIRGLCGRPGIKIL